MRSRWITDIEEFNGLAGEWDRLLINSGEDNPFLLSKFLLTWWKYYSPALVLRIFTVFDENGRLIGGLPLCGTKKGNLSYMGGWAANYTEFLSSGKDGSVLLLWKAFFESLQVTRDWQSLRLKRYRKNKLNIDALKILASERHNNLLFDFHKNGWGYLIKIPEDFSNYIGHIPKKLRYYVKRAEKELSKIGRVSLSSVGDCGQVSRIADDYVRFSQDSFRARGKKSVYENPRYRMFLKELINKFCSARYLDTNVLKLDDRIIAIHFGYSTGNNLNYVFTSFDMDFAEFSPGHLLIYKLIELGAKRRNEFLDFYSGWNLYKDKWCNLKDEIITIEIRRNSVGNKIKRSLNLRARNLPFLSKAKDVIRCSPFFAWVHKNN